MGFPLVLLILSAYLVRDTRSDEVKDNFFPIWQGPALTYVEWRIIDHMNYFTMDVKMRYSNRDNILSWSINGESFVIWSLNDQLLKYIYPTRTDGVEIMYMNQVYNPFKITTNHPDSVRDIMYPNMSKYRLVHSSPPYFKWVREEYFPKWFKCTVNIVQYEGEDPHILGVIYQEMNKYVTVQYRNHNYRDFYDSMGFVPYDIITLSPKNGTDNELTEELLTSEFLMGMIWRKEQPGKLKKTESTPQIEVASRAPRALGRFETPFPQEYECDACTFPAELDWRPCAYVSAVKDQDMCAACTLFAAVDVLESANLINFNERVDLSVQAAIDCSWGDRRRKEHVNNGCFAGFSDATFEWVGEMGGIPTTAEYGTFARVNGRCKLPIPNYGQFTMVAPISSYTKVPKSVNAMKMALLNHGPIAVALTLNEIEDYQRGTVISQPAVPDAPLRHAGVVVGYKTYNNSDKGYWIVKNSWGPDWGDEGYFYVDMSVENNPLKLYDEAYYVNMKTEVTKTYCDLCGCRTN